MTETYKTLYERWAHRYPDNNDLQRKGRIIYTYVSI
jgi:hypothetical protein